MFTLRFALRNLLRNKVRSIVTLLGVTTLLGLVTILMAIVGGFQQAREPSNQAKRLIVRHEVSLTINLPEAYWQRIRSVPHVVEVTPSSWFGGTYVDPNNFFARFFVEPASFLRMVAPEMVRLPPEQAAAWIADRQGCIVSDNLAARYGWRLGDRIVLVGDIYPMTAELRVLGIYEGTDRSLYFHRDYVEEAIGRPGRVGTFDVLVDDPANLAATSAAIDALFENSEAPTKSETEAAFAAGFVNMMGNVEGLVKKLTLIITATMLLTAGNTMAMAVRERTGDIAILKAMGFLPRRIVGFIVTEAMLLSGLAGLVGVGGMWLLTYLVFVVVGVQVPGLWFQPTPRAPLGIGLLLGSVALGLVAGLVPAVVAARRRVIDGLRRN